MHSIYERMLGNYLKNNLQFIIIEWVDVQFMFANKNIFVILYYILNLVCSYKLYQQIIESRNPVFWLTDNILLFICEQIHCFQLHYHCPKNKCMLFSLSDI